MFGDDCLRVTHGLLIAAQSSRTGRLRIGVSCV
jgi:hypothetical protein